MPAGASQALQQVKAAVQQQMAEQNQAMLLAGISQNCLAACDSDGRRRIEKKCVETCAARYVDAWNHVSKSLVNVQSQMG